MIQITKKIGTDAPNILKTKGVAEIAVFNAKADTGNYTFAFTSEIYGHDDVKSTLIVLQDYKCCFCESKIGHISYGDVEHFRPKAGWVQEEEKINSPGYYWLAYVWDNLLLSCQKCNQRYKKNHFPLVDPETRNIAGRNINAEEAQFIHPVNENPETYISFNEEIPIAIEENVRGDKTIKKLGLDRELLNEQRRATLNKIRDIYDLAKGYPDTYPELKTKAKQKIEKYLAESKLDSTEYSLMLRVFFRKNPVDF